MNGKKTEIASHDAWVMRNAFQPRIRKRLTETVLKSCAHVKNARVRKHVLCGVPFTFCKAPVLSVLMCSSV